jgi:hypothetical protein
MYLELTDDSDPLLKTPEVQQARSRHTAKKQLDIARAKSHREKQAKLEGSRIKELQAKGHLSDYQATADLTIYKGDSRDWIKGIPGGVLDWFHWDPPYGGREGEGGAFAGHKAIQTDLDYCLGLMEAMLSEIHRVLREGAWLAFWYTPVHYNWIRLLLQGHRFDREGKCEFCKRHIIQDYTGLTNLYYCPWSPFPFWVNPYPNNWIKTDRVADGHEITRFFVKETEPFFLAGKIHGVPDVAKAADIKLPILQISGRGNTFHHPNVSRSERRHVNHKPPNLLRDILSAISVPGSLGGDAGLGSGSIIEAALDSGRKIIGAEIEEGHWKDSYSIALERYRRGNVSPKMVAEWLLP